jgi:uncharacterized damage-inducible protein DinB
MERSLVPVAEIFDLNADLLLNCLEGVSEAQALERLLPGTNSMAFVAAHLVDARHFISRLLQRPIANPLESMLGQVTRIEEVTALPALNELREMWTAVGEHLHTCLETASEELLARPSPQRFPMREGSLLSGIAFLAQHESYHLGQLAILRKALGYPAMAYSRRERHPIT